MRLRDSIRIEIGCLSLPRASAGRVAPGPSSLVLMNWRFLKRSRMKGSPGADAFSGLRELGASASGEKEYSMFPNEPKGI